jgi:hypothetical protein
LPPSVDLRGLAAWQHYAATLRYYFRAWGAREEEAERRSERAGEEAPCTAYLAWRKEASYVAWRRVRARMVTEAQRFAAEARRKHAREAGVLFFARVRMEVEAVRVGCERAGMVCVEGAWRTWQLGVYRGAQGRERRGMADAHMQRRLRMRFLGLLAEVRTPSAHILCIPSPATPCFVLQEGIGNLRCSPIPVLLQEGVRNAASCVARNAAPCVAATYPGKAPS